MQEVFLRILRYRKTYRMQQSFKVWMYQIARNIWKDGIKEDTSTDAHKTQVEVADKTPSADNVLEQREQIESLYRALKLLTPEKRELLVLHRIQGLKYEEIATVMQCPVGTVKTRIHRALEDMRLLLRNHDEKNDDAK